MSVQWYFCILTTTLRTKVIKYYPCHAKDKLIFWITGLEARTHQCKVVVTPGFLCFLSGGRCKHPSSYPAGSKARQITMISKCSKEKHEQRKEEWTATKPRPVLRNRENRRNCEVWWCWLQAVHWLCHCLIFFFRQGYSSSMGSNKLGGKGTHGNKRMVCPGKGGGAVGESRFLRLAVSTSPWEPGKILFFHVEWKKRNVHFPSAILCTWDSTWENQSPFTLRPRSVSKRDIFLSSQDNR